MKKVILAISALVLISSCKEQLPTGLTTYQSFISTDSTNLLSVVPIAQLKNVLVEEFTGVRCQACPAGSVSLELIQNSNPNRVVVAKIHSDFQSEPDANQPDLRNADANFLYDHFSPPGKPSATVDRIKKDSTTSVFTRGEWTNPINNELLKTTIVNIDLTKQINITNDTVYLKSTFTFTDSTSQPLAYDVYFLENNVIASQDSIGNSGFVKIPTYVHNEILRKSITPIIIGTNLPNIIQAKGRFYIRSLPISFPSNVINKSNCSIVVFIHNRDTKEVLQVQKIDL